MPPRTINPLKGTRDLYPEDALVRRYITGAWRDASIRCGFEEIEGPTIEPSELYSIKSGDGILSELFQVFSGKSEREIEEVRTTGRAPAALRPEFTPTLARMYAAHARSLPKPCKWFTAGPYFRAERPQRGRLREFLQWNVDAIGLPSDDDTPESRAALDAEIIGCAARMFETLGLTEDLVRIKFNDRALVSAHLKTLGVGENQLNDALAILDRKGKIPGDALADQARDAGLPDAFIASAARADDLDLDLGALPVVGACAAAGLDAWAELDASIVRGLAYYTGTVFEAIAEGERAVAGGGRYDTLIELFGGAPTPACGFGMGDVVLTNLLQDHDLIPEGAQLRDAVSRPPASTRPDAFVVPNGDDDNEPLATRLASTLRRGVESQGWLDRDDRKPWDPDRYEVRPVHARVSYKSTRNLKKLRSEAAAQHARCFVEIHGPDKVEITDLDRRESLTSGAGSFTIDPASPHFAGRAIAEHRP